jgi:signal transduction histidine kinase
VPDSQPLTDVTTRVEDFTRGGNLGWATEALATHRDEILNRWLEAAKAQPFHLDRPDRAVADEIPRLFDALLVYVRRIAPRSVDSGAPLDDQAIRAAAQGHALARVENGLQTPDVLTEFRLLRQEVGRALRIAVPKDTPTGDIVSAGLILNDALDGAAALALAALTDRLEQMREEFLATTVHEVRQPITKISGFAQLAERMLDRPELDLSRVRESLHQIRDAANQMGTLLETLVDSSQNALGGLVLQPQTADIAAVLSDVIEHLEPDIAERVHIQVLGTGALHARLDVTRAEQVMNNIIGNAAKYSTLDSDITITVAVRGDRAVISVVDGGIGIPEDDLPLLFGRYVRAHNALGHAPGLGLGLYLSRAIVEAHGGRIWAESPGPGKGTTVFVELPLLTSQAV